MISKSKELFERAKSKIPGGVNSPVRAFNSVGGTPRFIKKAKGSKIYDVDENEYLDYVCSWGPSILGHSNETVVEAVQKACENGFTFGAPTEKEVELAELISDIIPSMEMVRLVSSGTEAVMSAIRLARGFTGRDKIIKFSGCYHGHSDGLLVKSGSGALFDTIHSSKGVPNSYIEHTLVAEFNDENSVKYLFEKNKNKIAAIIVEPVPANMGVVLPKDNFLDFLRKTADENGALLIFDEVITGFRICLGGASEYFGVKPDIITLGKIIGGGMPIGAYGGKKEIMSMISPLGSVYQAGTLSGNPIATTAGITTLNILKNKPEIYINLEKKAEKLSNAFANYREESVTVNRVSSLLSVFFNEKPVYDYQTALKSNVKKYANYFNFMLDRGIYFAPSQFEATFISNAHSEEDINYTCEMINQYFKNKD